MKSNTIFESLALQSKFVSLRTVAFYTTAQAFTAISIAFAEYYATQKVNKFGDEAFERFFKIGQGGPDKESIYAAFAINLTYFFGILTVRSAINFIEEVVCKEIYVRLFSAIQDSLFERIYSDQNLVKLAANDESKKLVAGIPDDVYTIAETTARVTSGFIKNAVQLGLGFYTIYKIGGRHAVVPVAFGTASYLVKSYLHEASAKASNEGRILGLKLSGFLGNHTEYAADVILNNLEKAEHTRLSGLSKDSYAQNTRYNFYSYCSMLWDSLAMNFELLIRYRFFARSLYLGHITLEQRGDTEVGISKISTFFNYVTSALESIKSLKHSVANINCILQVMNEPAGKGFERTVSERRLAVTGAKFKLNDKSLSFDELTLEQGQRCIIKGASGCGKSTFLSLLFGLAPGKHITGVEGNVNLPKNIAYISQGGYLPLSKSVRDVLQTTDQTKLAELINDAGISEILDRENSKDISGGQKKRLLLIAAILKNPALLVLDEAFTGLDHETADIMRKMIKKHLPNCILLSIVHTDKDTESSFDGFYTNSYLFDNDKVVFSSFQETAGR